MISTRKGEYFGTTEFNISIRSRSSHHTFSSSTHVLSGWAGGFYIKGITSRNWTLITPSLSTNLKAVNLRRLSSRSCLNISKCCLGISFTRDSLAPDKWLFWLEPGRRWQWRSRIKMHHNDRHPWKRFWSNNQSPSYSVKPGTKMILQ